MKLRLAISVNPNIGINPVTDCIQWGWGVNICTERLSAHASRPGRQIQRPCQATGRVYLRREKQDYEIDTLAAKHYSGLGLARTHRDYPVTVKWRSPNEGVILPRTGGSPTKPTIADTEIKGTQENARRKKIRSRSERFSQIAVLL
jgi:hypothetical protein